MRFFIGTSSFYCKDYVGPFYPLGTPAREFLKEYAKHFDCVEIDSTFYQVPSRKLLEGWYTASPENFRFSLKLYRGITHALFPEKEALESTVQAFFQNMSILQKKLRVILIQFPYFNRQVFPSQKLFLERLEKLLSILPPIFNFAIEIRNRNFWTPAYLALLQKFEAIPVLIDHPWMFYVAGYAERLKDFPQKKLYIRFLGSRKEIENALRQRMQTGQSEKMWAERAFPREERLRDWAEMILHRFQNVEEVYAFANRHFEGFAPGTALRFQEILAQYEGEKRPWI